MTSSLPCFVTFEIVIIPFHQELWAPYLNCWRIWRNGGYDTSGTYDVIAMRPNKTLTTLHTRRKLVFATSGFIASKVTKF